jgi:uncharacterized glyoxalase superfamily protein PhnB
MTYTIKSIRPFIGAKDYQISRKFYTDLGFEEIILSANMSYFKINEFGFYLQDAFVKDWIDNTMVFIELHDVNAFWEQLVASNITTSYPTSKIVPIRHNDWGKECFVHDPSGVLWHFGSFN